MNMITKTLLAGTFAVGVVGASPLVYNEVQQIDNYVRADFSGAKHEHLFVEVEGLRNAAQNTLASDPNIASQLRYQQLLKRLKNASRYLNNGVSEAAKYELAIANQLLSLPPHSGFPGVIGS
ncbi:hypothetical protein [Paraglaciecola sp. 2405UD69-4]|uniref:hypothetical protein n=1 Tax=Paraglaciecola sp. 2405UD69-4 TaxID=3391836 RepID=UPI0039C954FD